MSIEFARIFQETVLTLWRYCLRLKKITSSLSYKAQFWSMLEARTLKYSMAVSPQANYTDRVTATDSKASADLCV
jgi:hypothetical protein